MKTIQTAPASIGQEQAETKETSEMGKKSTVLKTTAKTEKSKLNWVKIAASEAPLKTNHRQQWWATRKQWSFTSLWRKTAEC